MNLTALQHSAFLQSLGWAIANSLWQAALLWFIFHLINKSYKNANARFRNNISTALLFSTFFWFLITFVIRYINLRHADEIILPGDEVSYPVNILGAYNWKLVLANMIRTLPFLSAGYLL